jgi:hypothetical protein
LNELKDDQERVVGEDWIDVKCQNVKGKVVMLKSSAIGHPERAQAISLTTFPAKDLPSNFRPDPSRIPVSAKNGCGRSG